MVPKCELKLQSGKIWFIKIKANYETGNSSKENWFTSLSRNNEDKKITRKNERVNFGSKIRFKNSIRETVVYED